MTPRRRRFERVHKLLGWSMLLVGGVVVVLGIRLTGAPDWLLTVVGGSYLALLLVAADQDKDGRRVDTYVATWGPLCSPLVGPRPGRPRRRGKAARGGGDERA